MLNKELNLTEFEAKVLRAIRRDYEASRNLDFLSKKMGYSGEELVSIFVQEARGPLYIDSSRSKRLQQCAKLTNCSNKVRRLAQEMSELNDWDHWALCVPYAGTNLLRRDRDAFYNLPKLLRLYAHNIDVKVEAFRRRREVILRRRGTSKAIFFQRLAAFVKQKAGRNYHDRLATILRVTYSEVGRSRIPSSGETLRKRKQRRKMSQANGSN